MTTAAKLYRRSVSPQVKLSTCTLDVRGFTTNSLVGQQPPVYSGPTDP